jgi:excisionase family DNA binding protein
MENDSKSPRSNRSWFTAKEAAEYIGVHLETLYRYTRRRKNKPPFRRLTESGPYRFPKDKFIPWADGPQDQGQ